MRRRTIIIYIAVVVVLAAGIAALSFWPKDGGEPEASESPSASATRGELIKVPQEEVLNVLFMPGDGAPYAIERDPDGDGFTLDAADGIFPIIKNDLSTIFSNAVNLPSVAIVTDEASDSQLSVFGFDQPVMTWRVNRADGTSVELVVGAIPAVGSGRYVRLSGSRAVYLLSAYQVGYLTRTLEGLYDLSFYPYPSQSYEQGWSAITECVLEKGDEIIEIRKRTLEEQTDAPLGSSLYVIVQPVASEGNAYTIQTSMYEPIASIAPSFIAEVNPGDLSVYGLDDPARLSLVCENEDERWSGTLFIGDYSTEHAGYYVMIEGHDAVLVDTAGDYRFLNTGYAYLRATLIWVVDIVTVSHLTFELDGTLRTLTFTHNDEDTSLTAKLDDKDISENNARRLYRAALSITQDGSTDAAIPTGGPAYRVTMYFRDGGSDTIELYGISESQYLIVHGGINGGLYINRLTLQQKLLGMFEILDGGGDLPM